MGHGSVNCFLLKDSVIYKANHTKIDGEVPAI